MCAIWNNHALKINQFLVDNNETKAHLYLEQLMLFPVDVQDKIIEEISQLPNCSTEKIAQIIGNHAMINLQ